MIIVYVPIPNFEPLGYWDSVTLALLFTPAAVSIALRCVISHSVHSSLLVLPV